MDLTKPLEILVVDDDPYMAKHVGHVVRMTLRNVARVSLASSPQSAMERLAEHDPKRSRLIIVSDYNLGSGMTGLEVLEAAKRLDPTARLILMSGEHPSRFGEIRARPDLHDFLEKPFTLEAIQASLERAAASP